MTAKRVSLPAGLFDPPAPEETNDDPISNFAAAGRGRFERRIDRQNRPKTMPAANYARARKEAEEMMSSGDWEGCAARHLVALYGMLHEKVYGVEAAELGPRQRHEATLIAGNFVKRHFGGDFVAAVECMRWVWNREASREKWRKENGRDGMRIGVRLMFGSGVFVTDYRVAVARTR